MNEPGSPSGTLNFTTSALSRRKADRTINQSEYIFIGKHPFDVFTPVFYSEKNSTSIEQRTCTSVKTRTK